MHPFGSTTALTIPPTEALDTEQSPLKADPPVKV